MGLDPISAFGAVAGGLLRGDIIRRQMDRQDMLDKLQADNASLRAAAAARKEQMDAMRMVLDATRVQTQRDRLGLEQENQGIRQGELEATRARNTAAERERAINRFLAPIQPYEKDTELAGAVDAPITAADRVRNPALAGVADTPLTDLRSYVQDTPEGVPGTPNYNPTEAYFLGNQFRASKKDILTKAQPILDRRALIKGAAAERGRELTPAQARQITEIDRVIRNSRAVIASLEEMEKREGGGPDFYKMKVNDFLRKYGAGYGIDPDFILYRARSQAALSQYIKEMSGTAVSAGEYARLASVVTDPMEDDFGTALIKANEFARVLQDHRDGMMSVFELTGKTVRPDLKSGNYGPNKKTKTRPGTKNALTDPDLD